MTDHAWLDAAAPYALGALSAEERAAFEAHLADCAICRAEVQALREVSGLLAHAAAAATPAPALRERILREARAVRPLAARGRSLRPWIAAAASLALAVAAGLGYWRASHARDALTRALAAARDTIAVRDSLVVTLLAPDVVLYSPVTGHPFRGRELVSALIGQLVGPKGFERIDLVHELPCSTCPPRPRAGPTSSGPSRPARRRSAWASSTRPPTAA